MCVCVFSSHSFRTSSSLDVPAGVAQEEGHTGFLIHLSGVRALIFLARRIQPFLSLFDREVEFCALTILLFSTRWAFLVLVFSFSVRKIPFAGIELTSQRARRKVTWLPLSYQGDSLQLLMCETLLLSFYAGPSFINQIVIILVNSRADRDFRSSSRDLRKVSIGGLGLLLSSFGWGKPNKTRDRW